MNVEKSVQGGLKNRLAGLLFKENNVQLEQVKKWMESVFQNSQGEDKKWGEKLSDPKFNIREALQKGVILCALINCLQPGTITKIKGDNNIRVCVMMIHKLENLKSFQDACSKLLGSNYVRNWEPQQVLKGKFTNLLEDLNKLKEYKPVKRTQQNPQQDNIKNILAMNPVKRAEWGTKQETKVHSETTQESDLLFNEHSITVRAAHNRTNQDASKGKTTLCANCKRSTDPPVPGSGIDYFRYGFTWRNWILKDTHLKSEVKIGSGGFGNVYSGTFLTKDVAIKVSNMDWNDVSEEEKTELLNDFHQEVEMLAILRHPNIVTFIGAVEEPKCKIVTELMENGGFNDALRTMAEYNLSEKALDMLINIADGMTYLHHMNIIHRDFKSANILVDKNWVAKIADFGYAKQINEISRCKGGIETKGTQGYQAPEILRAGGTYTKQSDVFAMGMVLWEMISGEYPFADEFGVEWSARKKICEAIQNGRRPKIPECPREYSRLIQSCWDQNPANRPTFEEIGFTLRKLKRRETAGKRYL